MKTLLTAILSVLSLYVLPAQTVLIQSGQSWQYFTGSDPGPGWADPAFNDSTWSSGPSQLGYGEGDEATVIPAGPTGNVYRTAYFRKTLQVANPLIFDLGYELKVKRDDGIVVYLNGTEVYRDNIVGTPSFTSTAFITCVDDGQIWLTATLPAGSLLPGNNEIAVEVHQVSGTSSDMSFDLELRGMITGGVALTRGPYLQMGTHDAMTLRWRTDNAAPSQVRYGTSPASLNLTATDPAAVTEHEITLTGLNPDTQYYYEIGTGTQPLQGDSVNYFRTYPLPGTEYEMDLWVTGDCGTAQLTQAAVQNQFLNHIGNKYVDAWLLLGDNAYNSGLDLEYQTGFFEPYQTQRIMKQTVIWSAPGNHDYYNTANLNSRSTPYFENFTLPTAGQMGGLPSNTESYYSYNIGNVHFVSLDSYGTENNQKMYDTTSAQAVWLKQDLAANTQKWTILYWHHPPYTMGSHDSDAETDLVTIRDAFIRMVERYRVDLILCGHSHCYERSKLMKGHYGMENTFSPALHNPDTSTARYDASPNSCPYVKQSSSPVNEGIVYVVAGSAGKFGGMAAKWPHNAMYYANASNGGSLYLKILGDRLDARFISDLGSIQDQFTIYKDRNNRTDLHIGLGDSVTLQASWTLDTYWPHNGAGSSSVTVQPWSTATYLVQDTPGCIADTFVVHVGPDVTAPVIQNCPADLLTGAAPGLCGATVTWAVPTATDARLQTFTGSHSSGGFFPVGITPVTYIATDSSGNADTCTFQIQVLDSEAPTLTGCAQFQVMDLCDGETFVFTSPAAADNCGPATVSQTSGPVSGSQPPPGSYTLTFTATDAAQNTASCGFTLNVWPLPNVMATLPADTVCQNETSFLLGGQPAGGTWTGTGVTGSSFDATVAGLGFHTLTYAYADAQGCAGQDTVILEVKPCLVAAAPAFAASIRLWPNPVHTTLHLDLPGNAPADIRFTDARGRSFTLPVTETAVYSSARVITFDAGGLSAGMYLVQVRQGDRIYLLRFTVRV